MSRKKPVLVLANEEAVRRIAHVIGPCSAADMALAELDMRRREGQSVAIFQTPSSWVVGPAPEVAP